MTSTIELMDTGMKYLIERLGTVEAERFISIIIKEKSDYTKWRQQYFANITSDEFHQAAVAYGKEHSILSA